MDWMSFVGVAVVPVLVALITAGGVWLGNRKGEARSRVLRDENTQQHAEGRALLEHLSVQVGGIDSKVDRLDTRMDGVQQWQAEHLRDNHT
jgi:hypothetical protein